MKRSSSSLLPLSAILLSVAGGLVTCATWECTQVITVDSPIIPASRELTPTEISPAIPQPFAFAATVMPAAFVEETSSPPLIRLPPVDLEPVETPPTAVSEAPRRLCPVQIEAVVDDIHPAQKPNRTGRRVEHVSDDSAAN